jgi:cell fate regulator YaaT (PSP1 superfamily)
MPLNGVTCITCGDLLPKILRKMGCIGCTVSTSNGSPKGCGSKGNCATGGCNRLNTYDWLSAMDITDTDPYDVVEVSFKNGARKGFYRLREHVRTVTGDMVVVETGNGFDVGTTCLSGELVRLQMRKKGVEEKDVTHEIVRKANERDLERLDEARSLEMKTMVRARVIARTLDLDMKIGDVEYQGDRRKATFYYTADGRVDFRELIRHFAKEFRVKIEMRQIGARQESARIGGIGSCGRELCCSTWLTDFKSVSTAAARYQNLAINQSKLSGQCGRLKCCLNYELDTYLDALEHFPENADKLETRYGKATLIKTDIFKQILYYSVAQENNRNKVYVLQLERVKEILEMNKNGEKPETLEGMDLFAMNNDIPEVDFEDGTGDIELPMEKRKKRKKRRKPGKKPSGKQQNRSKNTPPKGQSGQKSQNKQEGDKGKDPSQSPKKGNQRKNRRFRRKKK